MKKERKKTLQEKKNHINFITAYAMQLIHIALFEISYINYFKTNIGLWVVLFTIGLFGIILNTLWIFYIGYLYGWELKRISILEDE